VFFGQFLHRLVAAAGAAVTGAPLRAQQQWPVIGTVMAEFRYPLGGLPVLHPHIMVTGSDEQGRIGLFGYLLLGSVAADALGHLWVVRVSPFLVLADGQWQRRIVHGVPDVDE